MFVRPKPQNRRSHKHRRNARWTQKIFPLYLFAIVVLQAILFAKEYRIYSANDLSIRPNYVETICKDTAEYVKNTIPFSMKVAFPDHLCSHLTITALEKERKNIFTYKKVPRFFPNEVVIYYAIAERGKHNTQYEAQLDQIAYAKRYKKILISVLGNDRAYVYIRDN